MPLCGGNWGNGASAGVFNLNLNNPRSFVNWNVGFRSALLSLARYLLLKGNISVQRE
nr:MAG TPA: TREPONEMA DENTICOLA VARIABLE PROTEIN 1 FUNCTION, PERIODONTAL DISEASE [Caudoviricetes sp.]